VHLRTLTVGPLETNCYVVSAEAPDALVIDAGADAEAIIAHLDAERLVPAMLVVTHGHSDHIAANAELKRRYDEMKIAVGRADADALASPVKNMSVYVGMRIVSPRADRLLDDGDELTVAGLTFRVLALPGHSPGGIGLYTDDLAGAPALFAGDTLFARSVGRTDIAGGDWETLLATIRERIFTLPDDTRVYPGHGPATTVGEERASNPFVGGGGSSSSLPGVYPDLSGGQGRVRG